MNSKLKKTALIVTPYFPPSGGGLERYAFEIASRLKKDYDWRIAFVSSGEQNGSDKKIEEAGFTIYQLGFKTKLSNTPFSLSWFNKVPNILKEVKPDIINIHTPVPGLGNVFALFAGKIPFIVTYHAGSMRKGQPVIDALIWLYEHILLGFMLRRAYRIICSSDFVRFGFLKKYIFKSLTITSATDTEIFKPDETRKPNEKNILFVAGLGRSEQHKGLKLLIDIFADLHKAFKEVRLVVVGDGDMRKEYEKYVLERGLADVVDFKGKLKAGKLVQAYQSAYLFALPSQNDSLPTVIVEAMSTGLPVVSTKIGSIPMLVEDGKTGFLVDSNNFEMMIQKIQVLLQNTGLAYEFGQAGRFKAQKDYNWGERAKLYDEVFNQAIDPRPQIVQVCAYFPPHIGGMEVVVRELSLELSEGKFPVKIFTSNIQAKNEPAQESKTNLLIRRLRSIEFAHTPIIWTLPFRLMTLPKKSILHIHIAQAGLPEIVWLVAKIRRMPFIAHFHLDVGPSGLLGSLFLLYKKYILGSVLRAADKVIVFSEEQSALVQTLYRLKKEKLAIIPNGVGVEFFSDRPRQYPKDRLSLLYVGRLAIQKRVDRLLEALALLQTPVELVIVGDGEDRGKLENLAEQLKLSNVRFEGGKYGSELLAHYLQADIFLIPSDKEGMPLVVLEAMAAGLPVIGSDVLGIRELVSGTGVLVSNPSGETFATAITKTICEEGLLAALSQRSHEKAKKYSWKLITKQIEAVYLEILK